LNIIFGAEYAGMYSGGLGYRLNEAVNVLLGYKINRQLKAGYAFDISIGDVGQYAKGSHEIFLRYIFGYKVNASNPRNF
jgi:hypothetical protein